jgi:hypothetical protein
MRFHADGPAIPDDLLMARDAGDVIFFCGAGVSQHKASLPDFLKLGGDVLALLGAGEKSLAARLFKRIKDIGQMDGVGGLIATDRIFSLLEREFEVAEVRSAVAAAIRHDDGVDTSAHQILLDLSQARDGTVRLVTTNFDLLFEVCDPSLKTVGPPDLPDPRRDAFHGIIHLHGRVDSNYTGAGDEEFIVSSADFGRAYLSDGWATRFMQSLVARFQIVFVGYTADDPPVQYLLEALNLHAGDRSRLFAFQGGASADAQALWEHRGVRAIAFDNSQSYAPLWESLDAWAERARDVDGWYRRLLNMATDGPALLDPHVRGQIAHILSTREGARRLATMENPVPASWLLVLDPAQRYANPGSIDPLDEAAPRHDPYAQLALDFDLPPAPVDHDGTLANRAVPEGAWSGLLVTRADQDEAADLRGGGFHGPQAGSEAPLPPRLSSLGIWFQRVAHQPIALWWAAERAPLHPQIISSIEAWIRQDPKRWPEDIKLGWRRLFAAWSDSRNDPNTEVHAIDSRRELEGWSDFLVRDYAALFRPKLEVRRAFGQRHPLSWSKTDRPNTILSFDVDHPRPYIELALPDAFLNYAISLFRANLELARSMESEIRGRDNLYLQTTRGDDGGVPVGHDSYGLTGLIAHFQNLMERLGALSPDLAREEVARWPSADQGIFARLRIWAAGSQILPPEGAFSIFSGFPDIVFWGAMHERDLLFALRDSWADLTAPMRATLEERLLTGHFPWQDDDGVDRAHRIARDRLDRLHWLSGQGVEFSFDLDALTATLREAAPSWTPASAAAAADSQAPVVRRVDLDTDPDVLLDLPIPQILGRAREASQRDFFDFVERRPFMGLSEKRPTRALAALSLAARAGATPAPAWSAFLHSEARKKDPVRLACAIAARLVRLPPVDLKAIAYPVAEWLVGLDDRLYADLGAILPQLWTPLRTALCLGGDNRRHSVDSSWANDALNAPVGKLVTVVLKDPAIEGLALHAGLPDIWTSRMDDLLALPGDMRRHALVMVGHRINWAFAVDPGWTERQLLAVCDDEGDDGDALWDGILWSGQTPSEDLFARLKPALLRRALATERRRAESNVIAGFLLVGWGSERANLAQPLIASDELRDLLVESDDDLRTQVLFYLQTWPAQPDSPWRERVIPFLKEVWPHHRALRTPRMSSRLADLAFASGDLFPDIVPLILPRLVPVRGPSMHATMLDGAGELHPARRFPAATLDLLWAILAEDISRWPYRIEDVLDLLEQAPETRADPRLSELRRRRAL